MESLAKTGTDGILMVVEEPEALLLPEEIVLQVCAEKNHHFISSPLSVLEECGRISAWQEGDNLSRPVLGPGREAFVPGGEAFVPGGEALGPGGEDGHFTVMLEGSNTSSFDGSGGVVAVEEVIRESPGGGGGGTVGDRCADVMITSAGLEQRQCLSEVGQTVSVTTREKTSSYVFSGVTLTPSFLVGSGRKVYVPPPDPGNLEYVGVDSQSVGFWYDGGRNLYSCPALPENPQRVPSISELSLVCKSMLQWSNKLKLLRQSVVEADSKLAQGIKDYFIPRVKSATQRQPKDPNHVQRLVPLEHLKQLAEAMRSSKTSISPTTDAKPSPLLSSPFVPATITGGGMLVVPASTCHTIPVLSMFNPHFVFPSHTPPQYLDNAVTLTSFSGGSPNSKGTGGGEGEAGGMQTMTVEQGLALAQAFFSTSGIIQTDLGQPVILSVPPILRMTVTDPVRVDTVDFMSKSIEISGETPIRRVAVDNEDNAVTNRNAAAVLVAAAESEAGPNPATPSTVSGTGIDRRPAAVIMATMEDPALVELASLSQTHTSTEVMSAKMLLSLTEKEWCTPPITSDHASFRDPTHHVTTTMAPQSSLASSAPGLADSGVSLARHSKRTQRKQKPIASARQVDPTMPPKPPGRVRRKACRKGEERTVPPGGVGAESLSGAKRVRRAGAGRKRVAKGKQHQEATPHDRSTVGAGVSGVEGVAILNACGGDAHHSNDSASDRLLELKAQQSEIPVREYVIDTDSDSDTSSSGSTSDTGSSTEESSSDTTSEGVEEETFLRGDPFLSGQGIVGGRKGGIVGGRRGHVVKIPRHLLSEKLKNKSSRSAESEVDRLTQDIMADHPLDLATLYAHQGSLDLSTLSEITQQPSQPNSVETPVDTGSRSKRTCVRVREQIHRLKEILEGDGGSSSSLVSSPKSRGRSQKRGGEEEGGGSRTKKNRRSGYRNQFTHKRRKKRKKPSEDEPLWQSARKNPSGSMLTRVFVFSTDLANRAAESVERGEYNSIVQFHQAQPKGPGFFRPANETTQPDVIDQSLGKGDPSTRDLPKTELSRSPNSVVQRSSAASSPGGVAGEECDPRISPASLPSRTRSRQGRRLKKQSSWGGSTARSPPMTPEEALGSVGRTRKASPLPYKSPTDNHEGAFRWGNQRDQDDEHDVGTEERLGGREGRGGEDWSDPVGSMNNNGVRSSNIPLSSQRNQSETAVAALRQQHQHAVNHRSEVDGGSQGNVVSPAAISSLANPGTAREDANYTICHGTPAPGMQGDISSPTPDTRGMQQPLSVHSTSEASFSPRPSHPPPRGMQPQMEIPEHYGGQAAWNQSSQYPPSCGYHNPHHAQMSSLSYSAHPMSAMHGGYPYTLSYPWGHMVPPVPPQHHQLRVEEAVHMQQMGTHVGYMHPPPPSMMEEGGSSAKEVPTSMFLPNPPPLPHPPPQTADALSPIMSQASHPPLAAHQSSHGHHLQRHHQALPPDYFGHPSAHLFPYGFDMVGGLQHVHHFWPQQSHGSGGSPLPSVSMMHPGHMMPGGQGGWYPPHLVHSMVSGVEVHGGGGEGGKVALKKGGKHEGIQVVDVKLNSNGNNNVEFNTNGNNNGNGDGEQAELRGSSLEQPVAGRLCSDGGSPKVSVNSGALLLPLQVRWPFVKDAPIPVQLQKSEPFSVKVNWCK